MILVSFVVDAGTHYDEELSWAQEVSRVPQRGENIFFYDGLQRPQCWAVQSEPIYVADMNFYIVEIEESSHGLRDMLMERAAQTLDIPYPKLREEEEATRDQNR